MKRFVIFSSCLLLAGLLLLGSSQASFAATTPVQLNTGVSPGTVSNFEMVNPDGSTSPFVIPSGQKFVLTDITIEPLSGSEQPIMLNINLRQPLSGAGGGWRNCWNFFGITSNNIERSFTTGIWLTNTLEVESTLYSGQGCNIKILGFFTK